jgi:hypothetical protein
VASIAVDLDLLNLKGHAWFTELSLFMYCACENDIGISRKKIKCKKLTDVAILANE